MVKNAYKLNTVVDFDGCFCCEDQDFPENKISMSIVPVVNPDCFGFIPPEGFVPFDLACTQLQINHKSVEEGGIQKSNKKCVY